MLFPDKRAKNRFSAFCQVLFMPNYRVRLFPKYFLERLVVYRLQLNLKCMFYVNVCLNCYRLDMCLKILQACS